MPTIKTKVEITGDIARGTINPKLRRIFAGAVQELIDIADGQLAARLRPRPAGVYLAKAPSEGGSTGNYRRNISTRVTNLNGLVTDGGVIYGPWLEGTSSRNQTTRFKGYSSFRIVAQNVEKRSASVLKKYASHFAREQNR